MIRTRFRRTMVLSVAICCMGHLSDSWAWQSASTVQPGSQQIQFTPPVVGTCRMTSGSVTRGRIVSISESHVVMITDQNRDLTLDTNVVRTVRTSDGEFQFNPAEDDFSDAVRRASAIEGVEIVAVYNQTQGQPAPNQPPSGVNGSPAAPGIGRPSPQVGSNRPPAGTGNVPMGQRPDLGSPDSPPVYSSTPGFSNPHSTVQQDEPTVGATRCATCGNEISADSRLGQTCPHCGVVWVSDPVYRPRVTDTSPSTTAIYTSTPITPQTTPAGGVQPTTAPSTPTSAPTVGSSGNFSFDSMPIWAKVGVFLGFVGVLYLLVSGRR